MLKIVIREAIRERVQAKCSRHPRYDTERDGRAAIVDRCATCFSLLDLYQAKITLEQTIRDFRRRASPWQIRTETKKSRPEKRIEIGEKNPS
jgi:hypothetical protein